MKFLPELPDSPLKLKKNLFYWDAEISKTGKQFHLYEASYPVASLNLSEGRNNPAYYKLGNEVFEFQDNSTYFCASMLVVNKNGRQCIGKVQKSIHRQEEGTINIYGETYGWKVRTLHENSLLLMDQQHRRLITYHYSDDFVRLLLTKHALDDQQVIPLLCIGLYLLPFWHSPVKANP